MTFVALTLGILELIEMHAVNIGDVSLYCGLVGVEVWVVGMATQVRIEEGLLVFIDLLLS